MDSPRVVISFGLERELLKLRAAVLASHFKVITVTSLLELSRVSLAEGVTPDVLLLCHTVPDALVRHVIQIAHALWPEVRFLSMVTPTTGSHLLPEHLQIDSTQGPVHLLTSIDRALPFTLHGFAAF